MATFLFNIYPTLAPCLVSLLILAWVITQPQLTATSSRIGGIKQVGLMCSKTSSSEYSLCICLTAYTHITF